MLTKEPVEADNPLNSVKDSTKLIVTPHIAWATVEARTRLMDEVYENIKAFTEGKARNVVGYILFVEWETAVHPDCRSGQPYI